MSIKKYRYNGKEEFKIKHFDTSDKGNFSRREEAVEEFVSNLKEINKLQQKLYAARQEGVIFVFQAMDAAGKDGCIRTVFSTLTPHGVKEYCFKAPSTEELSHDYLWRFWNALPARGHISIFNRSYYEDVLIGKVHKLYKNQIVPERMRNIDVIAKRYREINDFERYLYNNATRVVKIFLNVSKNEQAKRFISRIDTPKKNWKVSAGDIAEREYWDEYQEAFETMINKTSSKKSPWYVVPADHKWYARLIVSRIVLETLKEMNPQFPDVDDTTMKSMHSYREELINSLPKKAQKEFNKNKTENDDSWNGEFDKLAKVCKKTSSEKLNDHYNEEDIETLMQLVEQEGEEDLLKLDGVEKDSDEKELKKKEKNNKDKKKKRHKKHKKNKKKSESHEIDVKEIMEEIDASTDNAFVDGSDVVVETILQEEAVKVEEKLSNESAALDETKIPGNENLTHNDSKTIDSLRIETTVVQEEPAVTQTHSDISEQENSELEI